MSHPISRPWPSQWPGDSLSARLRERPNSWTIHKSGGLGGTFAGNPVSCRAALAVLDQFEKKDLLTKAKGIGEKVMRRFTEFYGHYPIVGDVRGLGAMVGMELVADRKTKEPAAAYTKRLIDFCREKGLLMISAGTYSNIIRPLMPLVITDEQLEQGLSIIEDGLQELHQ